MEVADAPEVGSCLLTMIRNLPSRCTGFGIQLIVGGHTGVSLTESLRSIGWNEVGEELQAKLGVRVVMVALHGSIDVPPQEVAWNAHRVRALSSAMKLGFSYQRCE